MCVYMYVCSVVCLSVFQTLMYIMVRRIDDALCWKAGESGYLACMLE